MKLHVAAAACSLCSIVAMSSSLAAGEFQLSESQLDRVTAGADSLLTRSGGGLNSSLSAFTPPPPTPSTPTPTPTPTPPNLTDFLVGGGLGLQITVPTASGEDAQRVINFVFQPSETGGRVGAATQIIAGEGTGTAGGISATNFVNTSGS